MELSPQSNEMMEILPEIDKLPPGGEKESGSQNPDKRAPKITNFEKVRRFHEVFGHPVETGGAKWLNESRRLLRLSLIEEEWREVKEADANQDLENMAKELGDLLYVVYGKGLEMGIDLNRVVCAIHRSNMSKLCYSMEEVLDGAQMYKAKGVDTTFIDNGDGTFSLVRESDGKILKGPGYHEPELGAILQDGI